MSTIAPAPPRRSLLRARWLVAAFATVGFALLLWVSIPAFTTYNQIQGKRVALPDLPFNDVTKLALDVKLDQAKTLFTYNVLLLGILWGLVVVQKDVPGLSWGDVPEGVVFLLANVTAVLNALYYSYYVQLVSGAAASAARQGGKALSLPDVLDRRIDVFAEVQQYSLVGLLVLVALVVLSVNKLKG